MNTHTYLNVAPGDAERICAALTGKELGGRQLVCEPAKRAGERLDARGGLERQSGSPEVDRRRRVGEGRPRVSGDRSRPRRVAASVPQAAPMSVPPE